MTWSSEWGGRATDFVPDLLRVHGKPGRVAQVAVDALWEAVQILGEKDPHAWVKVTCNGWEEPDAPGAGRFTMTVRVLDTEPSELQEQLEDQRSVDLLETREPHTPPAPENPAQLTDLSREPGAHGS